MSDSDQPAAGPTWRSGIAAVWIAVLIFAAANSVVKLLADLGVQNPVEGRNPISFCNVLFVGNLCACIVLFAIYRKDWTGAKLRALTRGDWLSLVVLAFVSGALAPALIFLGIENTSVTNVILVGRIEPFLLLVFSALFLGERPSPWIAAGTVISLLGVGVAMALQMPERGVMLGKGEVQTAAGAALLALSTILSKSRLGRIPLGIFTVARTGLGAVVFFIAATWLFGPVHFVDVFTPIVWQTMAVYGAVVVGGGQLFWFIGIKSAATQDVSLATSFSPIAGIVFAFLLLGERPGPAILAAAAIILAGIAIAQLGERGRRRRPGPMAPADGIEAEGKVAFKGV